VGGVKMLTAYVEAAMRHAQFEWLEDSHEWYGEIPPCRGVWASGATVEACRAELRDVLEGWIALGLWRGDELPAVDGATIQVGMEN
jgi:predicted RNase H-like HicB family nuclease